MLIQLSMKRYSMTLGKPLLGVMRPSAISLCLVIVTFMIRDAAGTLTVLPQNHAAMSGQKVTMQCQTNGEYKLRWKGQRPGSSKKDEFVVYSGYNFSSYAASFCELNSSLDGDYSLQITPNVEAALRYTCVEPGSLEAWSAQLIVLKSHPRCVTTFGVDYVNITCVIEFHGHWAPTMEWRQCDVTDETVIINDTNSSVLPNKRVSSTLIRSEKGSNKGTRYKLTTSFKKDNRPPGTDADNVPDYKNMTCFNIPGEEATGTTSGIGDSSNAIWWLVFMIPLVSIAVISLVLGICYFKRARANQRPKISSHNQLCVNQMEASFCCLEFLHRCRCSTSVPLIRQ